ncbi:hypothetical protein K9U39_12485 [Rhodoblastus acidophilus]|uniref:Uncharacterized protein n=1 Tax=Candidatus Rhodoblastus alkanivorans TaxID=2954117 RepID=A0ABS9ZAH9_9HYPH|nr:hypothetical protein [Candidatus Rhodoblastus alkanivorans]MCI4677073.1 hypothetical protein [Candidatus Rhodoblastus alkanivorans]MCI4684426.1 hypothetical protein [Candidatus Rhodoblastus alkanivorans]MDI4641747.1 hypothetical protein [Rhodoblastus acidophilus]
MGYLHPPPGNAPVVVIKDVGGDVRQYAAQTNAYIRSGREVRLHECRSACTLALAVPNVCVYPNSLLRFHKAYNPITKATNDWVSDAMMVAYPPAVRARLGILNRQYKTLTGSELIRLGVRDCNAPASPGIMVARASARPVGPRNPLSNAFAALTVGFSAPDIPVYHGYGAPVRVARVKIPPAQDQRAQDQPAEAGPVPASQGDATATSPATAPSMEAPLPPPRPLELAGLPDPAAAPPEAAPPVPAPPDRPPAPRTRFSAWTAQIRGSAPVLASARFTPFPYRLTGDG